MKKIIAFIAISITTVFSIYSTDLFVMEGLDVLKDVKAAYAEKYICYTGELVSSYWEYPVDGNGTVEWETPLVPSAIKERKIVFSIACGIGASKGEDGKHTLFFNDRKVAEFNAPYREKIVWQGEGGKIEFSTILVDGCNDLFGIMRIIPNPAFLNYGQNQKIRVTGGNNQSHAWFMLSVVGKTTSVDIAEISKKRNIASRLTSIVLANEELAKKK